MQKKIMALLCAAALCAGLTGCQSSQYADVKKAQKTAGCLSSGRIIVTAGYENENKSDQTITEFVFKTLPTGNYSYCQTQYDRNNRAVYCEYSDGKKAEQWLTGKGWGSMDPKICNKKSPPKYLKYLSTPFEKKAVQKVSASDEDTGTRYSISLKADELNRTVYQNTDARLLSENISAFIDKDGQLLSYNDDAKIKDVQNGKESSYNLDMKVSQQNAVKQIMKPDLRSYAPPVSAGL